MDSLQERLLTLESGVDKIISEVDRLRTVNTAMLRAIAMAIPGYYVSGDASLERLLGLCRAYKLATGQRHPADRWSEITEGEKR